MKFDFDTFEFAGLIAPGSVIVIAMALLDPQLLGVGNAALLIAVAIVAAYVTGHLVAAVGNAAEPLFRLVGTRGLASLSDEQWNAQGYIADDQKERLEKLVVSKLHRRYPIGAPRSTQRKTVVKQMYLAVIDNRQAQRLTTFDGLYNLSRGLAVSFLICLVMTVVVRQYAAAGFFFVAFGLAVFRTRKFNDLYGRELIQQFLLLDENAQSLSPSSGS